MSSVAQAPSSNHGGAPDPESDIKPDGLTDMKGPYWKYAFRRAIAEFSRDQATDLAAALTYFTVSAIFPGLLAVISLLGVFGQGQATAEAIVNLLNQFLPPQVVGLVEQPILGLVTSTGAGVVALIIGLATALWSASAYVKAFSRALNRMYEVEEGRGFIKLNLTLVLVTLLLVLVVVAAMLMLLLSGGIARQLGDLIGLGATAVTVWNIAKWPVLLFLVVLMVAVLYYFTPNVKQPKFRWMSVGAGIAILVLILAVAGFTIYITSFGGSEGYAQTYGALAGVIIALLLIWIANCVLLLGAEIDIEMERARELQGSVPAEKQIQLPYRDDAQIQKKEDKREQLIDDGRDLRLRDLHSDD